MKVDTKLLIIVLLIVINLNSIMLFSTVFYGTSDTLLAKLTGKAQSQGAISVCFDKFMNITQLPDQNAIAGVPYSVDVNVSDEAIHPFLNFTDDSALFIINRSTGVISFTPLLAGVGDYVVNVTVSNEQCNVYDDYMLFNLSINQSNFAPILNLSSNFTNLVQGKLFYFNVSNNATDPDGDPLLFYDNTSMFNIGLTTGIIAFTPTNDDVGNNSVTITVSDTALVDDQSVIFEVENINDPPVLVPIGAQTAYVNKTFKINISAYDADTDFYTENLTFWSNYSWFLNQSGPNSTSGSGVNMTLTMNFTNYSQWAGTYNVNVSVNDSNGSLDYEIISFTITFINRPPNITYYNPNWTSQNIYSGSTSYYFNITKYDPDGTTPSTQWLVNDVLMNTTDNYTWDSSVPEATYNITVRITDGQYDDAHSWIVNVIPRPVVVLGTSVGGGGLSPSVWREFCDELWTCTDWNKCPVTGVQTRSCEDLHKCETVANKPNITRNCIYVEFPTCSDGIQNQDEVLIDCGGVCPPCPTCDDGIQNHGEEGVDCGGPCPACKEVREPTKPIKLEYSPEEIFSNINRYWLFWLFASLVGLSLLRFLAYLKHGHVAGLATGAIEPIVSGVQALRMRMLLRKVDKLTKANDVAKAKKAYAKAKQIYSKLPRSKRAKMKF